MDTPQKTAIRRSSGLGPLGDHAARFGQSLSDRNYAKDTIARYLRCLALLAQAMEREGVALEDLDEAQAVALVGENIRRGRSATSRAFVVGRFARFLADQSLGKPPAPPTLKEFARAERDLSTPAARPERENDLPLLAVRRPFLGIPLWRRGRGTVADYVG